MTCEGEGPWCSQRPELLHCHARTSAGRTTIPEPVLAIAATVVCGVYLLLGRQAKTPIFGDCDAVKGACTVALHKQ